MNKTQRQEQLKMDADFEEQKLKSATASPTTSISPSLSQLQTRQDLKNDSLSTSAPSPRENQEQEREKRQSLIFQAEKISDSGSTSSRVTLGTLDSENTERRTEKEKSLLKSTFGNFPEIPTQGVTSAGKPEGLLSSVLKLKSIDSPKNVLQSINNELEATGGLTIAKAATGITFLLPKIPKRENIPKLKLKNIVSIEDACISSASILSSSRKSKKPKGNVRFNMSANVSFAGTVLFTLPFYSFSQ
jgi:hypothetical protein